VSVTPRTTAPLFLYGASGMLAGELARLCEQHPGLRVEGAVSRHENRLDDVHPHLRGFTELEFSNQAPVELAGDHEAVLFAAPHGVAAAHAPALLEADPELKVIDLSGDFRLATGALYAEHYGQEHPHPEWLGRATYGAAECGRREELRGARLVANPGCHALATRASPATWSPCSWVTRIPDSCSGVRPTRASRLVVSATLNPQSTISKVVPHSTRVALPRPPLPREQKRNRWGATIVAQDTTRCACAILRADDIHPRKPA